MPGVAGKAADVADLAGDEHQGGPPVGGNVFDNLLIGAERKGRQRIGIFGELEGLAHGERVPLAEGAENVQLLELAQRFTRAEDTPLSPKQLRALEALSYLE